MSRLFYAIFIAAAFCGSADSAKLPTFVTPCKRSDPNLVECATKEGRKVLPRVLDGIPDLKLPNMKPLKLPEVNIDVGGNLKIKLTDMNIFGLDNHNLKKFDVNFDKKTIEVMISFDQLNIQSQYEINGKILVLPINGKGPANITFVGPDFDFMTDTEYVTKNNKDYVKIKDPNIKYTSKREFYILNNLFNGDKALGDQMNKFLDENWQDVSKEIGPAVLEVVSAVVQIVANAFFSRIPLENLIPK